MNKTIIMKVIKTIWVLIAIFVLCNTLYEHYMTHSPEIALGGTMMMIVLSVPSGLLVVLLLNIAAMIIGTIFSVYLPDNYFTIIATWSLIFAAGYFQWFMLAPIIWKKLRDKNKKKKGTEKGKRGRFQFSLL